jgi:phage-related baseplate assembly protein
MPLTFLDTDPTACFARLKAVFEAHAGRVLYPAQVENLLLKALAYADSERRIATQFAAEQNLVIYAVGAHLDALGANMETPRLAPAPAECSVAFALAEPSPLGTSIPAGTRVQSADGIFVFETLNPAYVIKGRAASSPVLARCAAPGKAANGLEPGVLCCIKPLEGHPLPGVTAANTTITGGGGDLETDDAYRARLLLSPARWGGGTASGYRLAALTASAEVSDALAVAGEQPGDIRIYVLAKNGDPPGPLLAKVSIRCNADDVRLIGDHVTVAAAVAVPYAIRATIKVRSNQDPAEIQDKVRALALAYAAEKAAKLGADVTPTQVLLALSPVKEAIYTVELQEPAAILEIGANEWAQLSTEPEITLDPTGTIDE